MKYFWAIVVVLVMLYGYKYFDAVHKTVAADAVAKVETQVQQGIEQSEGDTKDATEKILAKRPARAAVVKAKQEKDREVAKVAEQADPALAAWAEARVPDAVVDELWANAVAQSNLRPNSDKGESGAAVRSSGATATQETDDRSTVERLRDFVTGRN